MVRVFAIAALAFFLTACGGGAAVKLRTETVEVKRPVLYCPAPNYEELDRPAALPIDSINANTPVGEVAVRYKATVLMLQQYIERLELTLEKYNDTSQALDGLQQELNQQSAQ